jgi:predicted secreted protein
MRMRGGAVAAVIAVIAAGGVAACSRPSAPPVDASADAGASADASASADAGASADASASADADASEGADAGGVDAGDGGGDSRTTKPRVGHLEEDSEGKTVELAQGMTLVVMLKANPSTGFDWAVMKAPAALGAPDMSYVAGGDQPGAPGKRRLAWTLKTPLPAGEQPVELGYARSFEKGVAPFKTFKFKVRAAR